MNKVCEGVSSLWFQEVNRGGLLRLEKEVMTRLEKSRSEQLNVKDTLTQRRARKQQSPTFGCVNNARQSLADY